MKRNLEKKIEKFKKAFTEEQRSQIDLSLEETRDLFKMSLPESGVPDMDTVFHLTWNTWKAAYMTGYDAAKKEEAQKNLKSLS